MKPIYAVFEHAHFPSGNCLVTLFHICATEELALARKRMHEEYQSEEITTLKITYNVIKMALEENF